MPHQYANDDVLSTASVHAKLQPETARNNNTHHIGAIRFHSHPRRPPADANATAANSKNPATRLAAGPIRGRQSQTWIRMPEGWRIVSAHVSLLTA